MNSGIKRSNFSKSTYKPKPVRKIFIQFQHKIPFRLLSAFRGAVIEKAGRENILFNNHLDDKEYLYQYPLIQYKWIDGHPGLFCLGDGTDEVHKLFHRKDWILNLKGQSYQLIVDKLGIDHLEYHHGNDFYSYSISNWLGLNARNYLLFRELNDAKSRIELLEKVLVGNILSFAKGVNWHIDKPIVIEITSNPSFQQVKYKDMEALTFDFEFSSNIKLPDYLGLGKGASHGQGMVQSNNSISSTI